MKVRRREERSSGRRPRYSPWAEMTDTECPRTAIFIESPGWRREMILGSPRRIREAVRVTPGSSRNRGMIGVEDILVGLRLMVEVLRRFRFLVAMGLNLSRCRTLL